MTFATALLGIAIALQTLPKPVEGQPPNGRQERSTQQNTSDQINHASLQQPVPAQIPTVGSGTKENNSPAINEGSGTAKTTGKEKQERPPWWDVTWATWALVVVTLLLVLIGGLAALAALIGLGFIYKQTRDAGVAARAAEKSANAALLNAQIMINTERALVEVELGEPSHDIDERTGETAHFLRRGFKITNYGRTVAHIISFGIGTGCFPGYCRFRIEDFETSRSRTEHSLLAVGKSATLFDLDVGQLFTDWPCIQDETKTGMLRLEVRYEDIIKGQRDKSSSESYETSAIFYYAPVFEELRRLPIYNVYK